MEYYKELYVGESLRKKKDEILKKLATGENMLSIYVITLANGKHNQLEFCKSLLWEKGRLVVGIANGYAEALEVIEVITRDVYDATGGAAIYKYICAKQREE